MVLDVGDIGLRSRTDSICDSYDAPVSETASVSAMLRRGRRPPVRKPRAPAMANVTFRMRNSPYFVYVMLLCNNMCCTILG